MDPFLCFCFCVLKQTQSACGKHVHIFQVKITEDRPFMHGLLILKGHFDRVINSPTQSTVCLFLCFVFIFYLLTSFRLQEKHLFKNWDTIELYCYKNVFFPCYTFPSHVCLFVCFKSIFLSVILIHRIGLYSMGVWYCDSVISIILQTIFIIIRQYSLF